ncbi:hypothetical protein [Streptomyces sp. NPDC001108]
MPDEGEFMVYSEPQVFGELTLVFSVYESAPPSGYFSLAADTGGGIMAWVKETTPGSGALAEPTNWRLLGESGNLKIWRGDAPSGYRMLTDAFAGVTWGHTIDRKYIRCVKEVINGRRYVALGSSLMTGPFRMARSPAIIPEGTGVLVAPGECAWTTYGGNDPGSTYVLDLPMKVVTGSSPKEPIISDYNAVPGTTQEEIYREVVVPCTAVTDHEKSWDWILKNSPTYTVRCKRYYTLVGSLNLKDNGRDGSISESVMWGVEKTAAETFRASVGLTVGYEGGAEFMGASAKTSVSLSLELGYESMHSVTAMQQTTKVVDCTAPAYHTTGLYAETHRIEVVRNDADHTHASGNQGIDFKAYGRYMSTCYPKMSDDEAEERRADLAVSSPK